MDDRQFDALVKQVVQVRLSRLAALRGVAAGMLAGLAHLTLSADESDAKAHHHTRKRTGQAKRQDKPGQARAQEAETVILCHCPPGNSRQCQTLEVPFSAVSAHLAHGDQVRACETTTTAPPSGEPCGEYRQPCCVTPSGDACRGTTLICAPPTRTCVFCGYFTEPCCVSDNCVDGAICVAGRCEACGLRGRPCCRDGSCGRGTCVDGMCR